MTSGFEGLQASSRKGGFRTFKPTINFSFLLLSTLRPCFTFLGASLFRVSYIYFSRFNLLKSSFFFFFGSGSLAFLRPLGVVLEGVPTDAGGLMPDALDAILDG